MLGTDRKKLDSLDQLLEEAGEFPLLDRRDEFETARRAQRGNLEARDRLVKHNLRFAFSIARRNQGRGLDLKDLVSIAHERLIKSAEGFDPMKGVKFTTYAARVIQRGIYDELANQGRVIRLPTKIAAEQARIFGMYNSLFQEMEDEGLAMKETAERMGHDIGYVREVVGREHPLRIDHTIGPEDGSSALDVLDLDTGQSPEDRTIESLHNRYLRKVMDHLLTARENEILRRYHEFDGMAPSTLQEIGQRFGVTRERIRQLRDRGYDVIREHLLDPKPLEEVELREIVMKERQQPYGLRRGA